MSTVSTEEFACPPSWHGACIGRYRECIVHEGYGISVVLSVCLFVLGMVVNTFAINFATIHASNSVTDIILSNTSAFDVDLLFVYGTFVLSFITILLCLNSPKSIPFALYSIGLFFLIRSGFVSLTHLAPFEPHTTVDFGVRITKMFFGGDRFFSGHTGLPFLGALIFWHYPLIRYFYLGGSIFFGTIVLMGHLHYSIDVFAAFFITHGIYHIALFLFPSARALFLEDDPSLRDVV